MAGGLLWFGKGSGKAPVSPPEPGREPDQLIADLVPRIRQTVRRRLATARHIAPEDEEDVVSDAIAALLARLRRVRQEGSAIEDLDAYAAGIASNAADRFFGKRAPQRTRLRLRIRYVLTTVARFRLEMSGTGAWKCSLNETERLLSGGKLARLIEQILEGAGGPLDLHELTTQAARLLGVSDRTEELGPEAESTEIPCVADRVELRDCLATLWREVVNLPERQRTALLLQFGAAENCSMCSLVDLGIVRFAELATVLALSKEELADLWNRVPLSDREIAERLGITRQQVINLRTAARERLSRRLTKMSENFGTNRKEAGTR